MQVTNIQLTDDENKRLITAFTKKLEVYEKKQASMQKEMDIITSLKGSPPPNVSSSWVGELTKKINQYNAAIAVGISEIALFKAFILGIQEKRPIKAKSGGIKQALADIYVTEREAKSLDPKYKYYPRLKKAKEESFYVFANKIKLIMEADSVKVA